MSFKTFFVNETDPEAAMAKFWEDFEPEAWSVYHLKYIVYKNENEVLFRFNNLLRGHMRAWEPYKKYIFGTHNVIGDEPNLDIQAVWLVQGNELIEEFTTNASYDSYEWIKLDHTNEEHKALVKKFWTGLKEEDVDEVDGKKLRTFNWVK